MKEKEAEGYQYEGADASFRILAERVLPDYRAPFELVDLLVVMEKGKEIAILKSMGATDTSVMKIFVSYGL